MTTFLKSFLIASLLIVLVEVGGVISFLILLCLAFIAFLIFMQMPISIKENIKEFLLSLLDNFLDTNPFLLFVGMVSPPIILLTLMTLYSTPYRIEDKDVTCNYLFIEEGITRFVDCSDNKEYIGYKATQGDK